MHLKIRPKLLSAVVLLFAFRFFKTFLVFVFFCGNQQLATDKDLGLKLTYVPFRLNFLNTACVLFCSIFKQKGAIMLGYFVNTVSAKGHS